VSVWDGRVCSRARCAGRVEQTASNERGGPRRTANARTAAPRERTSAPRAELRASLRERARGQASDFLVSGRLEVSSIGFGYPLADRDSEACD